MIELQEDLSKFYARQDRMRKMRSRVLAIALGILTGLGIAWLLWQALHH